MLYEYYLATGDLEAVNEVGQIHIFDFRILQIRLSVL